MTGVISVFAALLLWRFLILLGQAVFEAAGLSPSAAAFEARSALVGAGYTTEQTEAVVRNSAAQRVASLLIVIGYFGPTTIVALLGVSFVLPSSESQSMRAITLFALLFGLYVADRVGIIRAIGSRPSRAIAKRLIGATAYESVMTLGDRAIASILVPLDAARHESFATVLTGADVRILAIERANPGPTLFPAESETVVPGPGDRVVVLAPQQVLASLGNGAI